VQQYRGLAILDFELHEDQPQFTHAWFPTDAFDEWALRGDVAVARQGDGFVLIKASGRLEAITAGPSAGAELRLAGRKARWIVRVTDSADVANLDALIRRYGRLSFDVGADRHIRVEDPAYGTVTFGEDGTVTAEGRVLDPQTWTVKGRAERLGSRQAAIV
jgi:hypothetical protein